VNGACECAMCQLSVSQCECAMCQLSVSQCECVMCQLSVSQGECAMCQLSVSQECRGSFSVLRPQQPSTQQCELLHHISGLALVHAVPEQVLDEGVLVPP